MLQKQELDISFQLGLDQKTDKFRIKPGNFLSLENSVFDTIGRLTKRNGFAEATKLGSAASSLATFNGGLVAINDSLSSLAANSSTWVNKGAIKQVSLDVNAAVRTNTSQIQSDMAIAANNIACLVFTTELPATASTATLTYQYSLVDTTTGETLVAPTNIAVTVGSIAYSPKVFKLGNYFVIVFINNISGTYHLQYITINYSTLAVSTESDISTQITPFTTGAFDCVESNNNLYMAWNASDLGSGVRMRYLTSTLSLSNSVLVGAGHIANYIAITADVSTPTPVIWVGFTDFAAAKGYYLAVDASLVTILSQAQLIGSAATNITVTATGGVATFVYEISGSYSYDSTVGDNTLRTVTVNLSNVIGTDSVVQRTVGLASKGFLINNSMYFLTIYQSAYQPTFFLMDIKGDVIGKLASGNAGQDYTQFGLSNAAINQLEVYIPYLFKTQIQSVNKTQGVANTAGVYAQTGINVAHYNFSPSYTQTAEIGGSLQLSGGIVWQYDGRAPVELGFNIYPDNIKATNESAPVYTGNIVSGSPTITNLSSTTNLIVGTNIAGTGIPANSFIISVDSSTQITINNVATATNVGTSLTFTGDVINQQYFYACTYEWTDNAGNIHRSAPSIPFSLNTSASGKFNLIYVPYLKLTYKANIRVVIYRWSTAQQNYYQLQTVALPSLNDTGANAFLTYVDIEADANILGNTLLYTTGGVLENIAPPPANLMALIGSRMMVVSAEDSNLIWFSKQVIEDTPVEFSDSLTKYIPPTLSAQTSTGPITALSVMDDKWMIFKGNVIYYIAGQGPDNSGLNDQYSDPQFITAVVGCSNPNSIAMTPSGLMFQSNKGIWILNRDLSTNYIGAPVDMIATSNNVLNTLNIPKTNQVRFMLDNTTALIYDYYVGQWGTFTNLPSIANVLYQDLHTYIDSNGVILQETPGLYLDNSRPVLMAFTTSWISLAGIQGFERFYFSHLLGEYKSPFKLNLSFAYDYNDSALNTVQVMPTTPGKAYGNDPFYGSESPYGGSPIAFKARVFPSKQKCETFQVQVQETYDPSYGIVAGAGLTLSSLQLTVGMKRGTRTTAASRNFG